MIVQVSLCVALSVVFQNPTSIVNVLKFQYRRQRGDNRGGLAGEWWDGQNFPWAEDLSKLSLPARGFSDSIVKSALTILGGSVTWERRLLESGPAPTCLLSIPALGAPGQRVRARCAPKIYAREIIAKT